MKDNKENKGNTEIIKGGDAALYNDSSKKKRPLRSLFVLKFTPHILSKIDAKTLAFYYNCRMQYSNGIFYNWNRNKLTKRVGCSYDKAERYLDRLAKLGLIEYHHGNLCFKDISKLFEKELEILKPSMKYIEINVYETSEKDIERLILKLVMQNELRKQEYKIKSKRSLQGINSTSNGNLVDQPFLTSRSLSKKVHINKDRICKLIQDMKDNWEILSAPFKLTLSKDEVDDYQIPGHRYLFKNELHIYVGTLIKILKVSV